MTPNTEGIHHVTAIAGDPTRNAGFYVDTLGLRMVKRTVNHDDPTTYHFYRRNRPSASGSYGRLRLP
ncbi:MAG: VOC family protein, partial [Halorientalis sp.]